MDTIINKGTGAGGKNTNNTGKPFEEKTNNSSRLLENHFTDFNGYISKTFDDKTVTFTLQSGFKKYIKNKYNIHLFRNPDEAYIIEYNTGKKVIKILEKKAQHVDGSVETKLWASIGLKREYELVFGNDFEIHYGFCVNDFLKTKLISTNKKYTTLNTILQENNITILFGDDENYFSTLDTWIQ